VHSQKCRTACDVLDSLPFEPGWLNWLKRKSLPCRYSNGAEQARFAQFKSIKIFHARVALKKTAKDCSKPAG
jgi:hypothetical protein